MRWLAGQTEGVRPVPDIIESPEQRPDLLKSSPTPADTVALAAGRAPIAVRCWRCGRVDQTGVTTDCR